MEIKLAVSEDAFRDDSFYEITLTENGAYVNIELSNMSENRIIIVDAKQLRKALTAIEEDE